MIYEYSAWRRTAKSQNEFCDCISCVAERSEYERGKQPNE